MVPFHFQELNFLPACDHLPLLYAPDALRSWSMNRNSHGNFGSLTIISLAMLDRVVLNRLPTHLLPIGAVRHSHQDQVAATGHSA
jgi:hypothetical protein